MVTVNKAVIQNHNVVEIVLLTCMIVLHTIKATSYIYAFHDVSLFTTL